MKIKLSLLVVVITFILGCNHSEKNKHPQPNESRTIEPYLDSINTPDTFLFDKEIVFEKYYNLLIKSLDSNQIPDFLYNECLDASEAAYCDLGSHKSISLRYDLLKKLSTTQLNKVLKIGNIQKFKKVCNLTYQKEKLYGNLPVYDLIMLAKKENN